MDLTKPTFSDPTSITNPLFPRLPETQVIQLGTEAGDRLRFERTQLDRTRDIVWDGRRVETAVTHFVAYTNGRLVETALDYYAQADDGSVWYFGEDVDNYEAGVVANHDGSWLAGRDGPPGMIMPAHPKVGDVFRPENIPDLVFEEVTVTAVDQTVPETRGQVSGAIVIDARLLDGTVEEKIFAPGYGDLTARVASKDELYHIALAVPIDAVGGPVPADLTAISNGAAGVFRTVPSRRWGQVSASVDTMAAAWDRIRTGEIPALLEAQMSTFLDDLRAAVDRRDGAATRQASIDVSHASLDLQLRHADPEDVDEARLAVWQRQLVLDRSARDHAGVAGDKATISAIRDRLE